MVKANAEMTMQTKPTRRHDAAAPNDVPRSEIAESREERIRRAAYERFVQRAGGPGDAETDWREAEAADDAQRSQASHQAGNGSIDDTAGKEQAERTKTAQENVREGYDCTPGLGVVRPEPDEVRTKSADGAG